MSGGMGATSQGRIGGSRGDQLKPVIISSHRLKLADAVAGYKMFDKKDDTCRKVVMTP